MPVPVVLAGRCLSCGAALSRYAEPGAIRCAPCERSHAEAVDAGARILGPERLLEAVAGVLLMGAALRPGERIHVQAELERLGILADHVDVYGAVSKLRRRYSWHVFAIEGTPGYLLTRWPYRFTRRSRRSQLQLFTPR